jgi:hypothetical protein
LSTSEIAGLLADGSRPGAPEPTLLPWLTRRIAQSDLPAAAAAAGGTTSAPGNRWPVVADAVAAIIGERAYDPGRLRQILDILPPVAARLGTETAAAIDWAWTGGDAVGYAILGGLPPVLFRRARRRDLVDGPPWNVILTAPPTAPLADIEALYWLATTGPDTRAKTDQEAAYLLPFRSGPRARWQAREAIESAVSEGSYWYAAAMLARAAPRLDQDDQAWLRETVARMPPFWSSGLTRLTDLPVPRWNRDEDELAASHPAIPQLNELADRMDRDQLADLAVSVIWDIAARHRLINPWNTAPDQLAAPGSMAEPAPSRDLGLIRDRQRLLGREDVEEVEEAEEKAERHFNVYVAAAGREDPVPPSPLELDADYVLRCNIGAASRHSLVQGDLSVIPDDYLPDGPLKLRLVLFLDGYPPVIEPIDLPEEGDSDWVMLPLPRVNEPSVLHGDVTVYYGAAIVLMYGLILPFGGDGARGPEAVSRYQLSHTLTDLEKIEGRTMSFAVSGPASAPAIYVNDLTFAPTELRYDPRETDRGRFPLRTKFYDAHFSVRVDNGKKKEVSRFSSRQGHPFAKSPAEADRDLRVLARDGGQVFNYLFNLDRHRDRLRRMLRTEAEARGRPPVLQVVPLGDQPVPVPWAALYDLPLGRDIRKYEPCPSIAEFGPGGSAAQVPVNCPHEASHKDEDGERWKLNQLCPWGFWGLSVIIEHPPSTQARDLETQVRPAAGQLEILVGYDTELDSKLRRRHLEELEKTHGAGLLVPYVDGIDGIEQQLRGETMDVVYLYCHVFEDPDQPGQHIPAIHFDDGLVTSQDIDGWNDTSWAPRHWSRRHPLVIINGCSSAARGPGSLASLVGSFVETGASGVIGTEIAIDQGLGGWAMELFLSALRHQSVGEALRSMRWEMFRGGNLIGLAYTPYCLAGLTVSPHGRA